MDFYNFKNALFIGFFMAFMMGPVFLMLLETSVLKGIRSAIVFDAGVILGDISFILIAYFGSKDLLEQIKNDPRLFLIGGLILVVYGLIYYFDKNNKKEIKKSEIQFSANGSYFKLFLKGFFLNFINVGVLAFWLGLIVIVGPTLKMNPVTIFWYFATVILGYIITDLLKIILAKQLKKKLNSILIYRIKKVMGVLLIVFGILLMLKGFVPKKQINGLIEKVEKIRSN